MRASVISTLACAALVSACQWPEGERATAAFAASGTTATAPDVGAGASARSESRVGGAVEVKEETADLLFAYAWPAAVGRLPGLAAELDKRRQAAKAELVTQAQEARAEAEANGYPHRQHAYEMTWQVVTDLPGWISLSGAVYTYRGGAHPNSTTQSLVWDKANSRALNGVDLFTSADALQAALGTAYCEGMRSAWLDKLGQLPEGRPCPNLGELVVLPGSSNGRTFDRLTLVAPPYVAGPYAEGAYEFDLTIDSAVRRTVRPEYRDAFGG